MKTLSLLLLFSISNFSFAQKTNVAHYSIKYLFETDNADLSSRLNSFLNEAKKYEDNVELILLFNKERAVFEMVENTLNSLNKQAFTLCGCDKPIFTNAAHKTIKFNNKGSGSTGILEDKYLLVEDLFTDWELQDEQKEINGFTTYKAIKPITTVDGKKETIIAWYAPELPYPYGPSVYGGLPGLIVQLQEKEKMFVLSKLEFDKDVPIPAEPTKGEIMNAEAYKKMEYETYLNMSRR